MRPWNGNSKGNDTNKRDSHRLNGASLQLVKKAFLSSCLRISELLKVLKFDVLLNAQGTFSLTGRVAATLLPIALLVQKQASAQLHRSLAPPLAALP